MFTTGIITQNESLLLLHFKIITNCLIHVNYSLVMKRCYEDILFRLLVSHHAVKWHVIIYAILTYDVKICFRGIFVPASNCAYLSITMWKWWHNIVRRKCKGIMIADREPSWFKSKLKYQQSLTSFFKKRFSLVHKKSVRGGEPGTGYSGICVWL